MQELAIAIQNTEQVLELDKPKREKGNPHNSVRLG